jgi:molybdopterin molybdotransferase
MKSVEEYLAGVLGAIEPLPPLEMSLLEAHGCLLAEDVVAAVDLPPWDNSGMDGYAVRLSDVVGASKEFPAELPVVDDIAAGQVAKRPVTAGVCARIMTGAPVPEGAEAIVPVEWTDRGTDRVAIYEAPSPGQYIRARGSDVSVGEALLSAGVSLGPGQLGLLAAIGRARVLVAPRPRVVVISTGSELTEPGQELGPGGIYESNSFLLTAAAKDAGAIVSRVGFVHDDEDSVLALIEDQLSRADLIITSGGVSAGAYDVVKGVLSRLGTITFEGIKMNPGKPQGFGTIGPNATPIFTLPGNPVSSYVSFEIYVRPAIRKMMGRAPYSRPVTQATLLERVGSPAGKKQFARGWLGNTGEYGLPEVRPVGGAGSHLLGDLALANCFIVLGEDITEVGAGSQVDVVALTADPR